MTHAKQFPLVGTWRVFYSSDTIDHQIFNGCSVAIGVDHNGRYWIKNYDPRKRADTEWKNLFQSPDKRLIQLSIDSVYNGFITAVENESSTTKITGVIYSDPFTDDDDPGMWEADDIGTGPDSGNS